LKNKIVMKKFISTTGAVKELPAGVLVEIETIAVK
jgi:hypothetical protein